MESGSEREEKRTKKSWACRSDGIYWVQSLFDMVVSQAEQTMRDGHLVGIPSHPSIFSLTKRGWFSSVKDFVHPRCPQAQNDGGMPLECIFKVVSWYIKATWPKSTWDGWRIFWGGMMCGREFENRLYRFSICYQMACLYQSILFFYLECHPVENEWIGRLYSSRRPLLAVERKWADCQQRQIFSTLCPVPKLICGFFSSSHLLSKIIHFSKYHPRWSFSYKKQTISVLN